MEQATDKKEEASVFGSNVIKLFSGKVASQIIAIIAMPIVTRMYSPSDLGVLQVFLSITAFIVVISSMRYELAIMLPKKNEDAANLLVLSASIIGFITLITFIGVFFLKDYIAVVLDIPEMSFYLWFIPLTVFFGGLLHLLQQWSSRQKQFGKISFSAVSTSASRSALKLTIGAIGKAGPGGLIGSHISGSLIGVMILLAKNFHHDLSLIRNRVTVPKMIFWAKRYKQFPLISVWSGLLNSASIESIPVILALFFSPAIVGFYALANKIVKTPMNLVSDSIARVFFQKISEDKNKYDSISGTVGAIFRRLVAIGLFPMLVVAFFGSDLFNFVFGAQWAEAGYYLQFFAPWVFFRFISSPISSLFFVEEKHSKFLIFHTIMFILILTVLILGGIYSNPRTTIILLGMTNSLLYLIFCSIILSIAKVKLFQVFKVLLDHIIYSSVFIIIASLVKLGELGIFYIIISTFIGGAVYFYILFRRDSLFYNVILNFLSLKR